MSRPHETYCIASMKVNGVRFYILEIDSWGRAGVSIYGTKEEALEQVTRTENFIHDKLTETHEWITQSLVKLMTTMLRNSFKYHIAQRLDDRNIYFNGWSDELRSIVA